MATSMRVSLEECVQTYRREGFVKIDLAEIVGRDQFAGLHEAYEAADARGFDFNADSWNARGVAAVQRYTGVRFHYPQIADFVTSPRLGQLGKALMGVEHVRLFEDEAFVKEPGGPGTGWHQDLPYMPVDRRHFLTMWLAIDDVEADMSPMFYVPRSHTIGSLGRQLPFDPARRDEIDPSTMRALARAGQKDYRTLMTAEETERIGEQVTVLARAGEAIVHDGMLIHGSLPNTSSRRRRALGIVLISADVQYTGAARKEFDDLGLVPYQPFSHPRFPVTS